MKQILTILVLSLLLVGCGTTSTKPVETKPVYKGVPKQLTVRCPYPELPETKEYMALSREDREKLLIEIIKKQIKINGKCNTQFEGIEKWDAGQKEAIEGH